MNIVRFSMIVMLLNHATVHENSYTRHANQHAGTQADIDDIIKQPINLVYDSTNCIDKRVRASAKPASAIGLQSR